MSISTELGCKNMLRRLFDGCVSVLTQHMGRDKAMSAVYYALLFFAGRVNCANTANKLMAMAKQFSAARLVLRQFNDLPMIGANFVHFAHPPKDEKDRIFYDLQTAINLLYTAYTPIEHVAWLSDLKLLPFESSKWFKYSLFVWSAALSLSIARSALMLTRIQKRRGELESEIFKDENARKHLAKEEQEELLNLVSFLFDYLNAVNFLPYKGFLWAQSFPLWKTGLIGFVASCANLIKVFSALK